MIWRIHILVLSVAVLLAAGGCRKSVRVTFANATDAPVGVKMTSADGQTFGGGPIDGYPGLLRVVLRFAPDDLPADFTWTSGEHSGPIRIDEHTPAKLWVRIPGGVIDDLGAVARGYPSDPAYIEDAEERWRRGDPQRSRGDWQRRVRTPETDVRPTVPR